MCCCRQLGEPTCFLQGIINGTKLSLYNKFVLHAKNMTDQKRWTAKQMNPYYILKFNFSRHYQT